MKLWILGMLYAVTINATDFKNTSDGHPINLHIFRDFEEARIYEINLNLSDLTRQPKSPKKTKLPSNSPKKKSGIHNHTLVGKYTYTAKRYPVYLIATYNNATAHQRIAILTIDKKDSVSLEVAESGVIHCQVK